MVIHDPRGVQVVRPCPLGTDAELAADEFRRVPSPVVRALTGQPPVKLKKRSVATEDRSATVEVAPWIIYECVLRKGTREQHDWKACRSTATSCVAITEKEFQEHCSEYDETVGAEELEKLLRETPSAVAFNRGNLQPSNLVHSKEYQAW